MFSDFVHEELVFIKDSFSSKTDFFQQVSQTLESFDFVESSFDAAISDREKRFPTGLQLKKINVAIPHTDPQHVKQPFIAAYKLEQPVDFIQMATTDIIVSCELILVLGITEPKKQVQLLSRIIDLFGNDERLSEYRKLENTEDLYYFLKKNI